MSSSESDPDDCETVCDTEICSESCAYVHNRYDHDEFDEDSQSEFLSLGQISFVKWEKFEKKRLEMLNEAKDKTTKMEQTMLWWIECTALWRKKWSVVRGERNAARNTIDKLMSNLHLIQEDTLKYFEAKVEAEQEIQRLRAQVQELTQKLDNTSKVEEDLPVKTSCKV
ncbi:hypothetical protein M3Y97_00477000 [Aphelenchoides bicaudatus]|nr:hypothetical protein M3Y97_00477000 [Aphelenchoides bicaudatus]